MKYIRDLKVPSSNESHNYVPQREKSHTEDSDLEEISIKKPKFPVCASDHSDHSSLGAHQNPRALNDPNLTREGWHPFSSLESGHPFSSHFKVQEGRESEPKEEAKGGDLNLHSESLSEHDQNPDNIRYDHTWRRQTDNVVDWGYDNDSRGSDSGYGSGVDNDLTRAEHSHSIYGEESQKNEEN